MRELTTPHYLSYLHSQQGQATFRLSQQVTSSLRSYLDEAGFVEFLPPVISSVTDPGLRGAERVSISLYGQKAFVTSSMVFHKQVLATAFKKIYSFAPNVRLEPADHVESGRHLVEFCQLDLEESDISYEDSMSLAEAMISKTIADVTAKCQPHLTELGRQLTIPATPFPRFTYAEMLTKANKLGLDIKYGDELPQAVESQVSQDVGSFFWITDYPKVSRGFYYRESDQPTIVRSMDLIYPEGFGEAISGGEREYLPSTISRRIREHNLDLADFDQFLSLADKGLRPTSGFGIGIERLVRYITGQRDITLVRPFPKSPGQIAM